jgi:hypothetical protein
MRAREFISKNITNEAGSFDTLAKGTPAPTQVGKITSVGTNQTGQSSGGPLSTTGTMLQNKDTASNTSDKNPQQILANKQQQQLTMNNLDKIAAQIVALKQNLTKQQTS